MSRTRKDTLKRLKALSDQSKHWDTDDNPYIAKTAGHVQEAYLAAQWGRWLFAHKLLCSAANASWGLELVELEGTLGILERRAYQHASY